MSKRETECPDHTHSRPEHDRQSIPEIRCKMQNSNAAGSPLFTAGRCAGEIYRGVQPASHITPAADNDLARDNLEQDIPAADLQEL